MANVTLYLIDQHGAKRAYAIGTTEQDARVMLEVDRTHYRQTRPDLRVRIVSAVNLNANLQES